VIATTGNAEAALFDAGPIAMTSDIDGQHDCGAAPCRTTAGGERFDCALLSSDATLGWATGSLAGAWPAVGTLQLGDGVATLRLRCQ
jgi:hypothetical protein